MKKTIYILSFFTAFAILVASCEIDNFPSPDAQVYGAIRDSVGDGLVETDIQNGSQIGAYEQGFATPELRNWVVKQNGEYRNDLVYSNTYDFVFQNCNFFPYTLKGVVIKPGANERDFYVVPFIRVVNPSITYDASTKKVNATFSLKAGKPSVQVSRVTLYVFTDIYVGEYVKKTIAAGTGVPTMNITGANRIIDPERIYNLSIDLNANASVFEIHRNYYFRIGAQAIQSGVGTVRPNYAPAVKIAL